MKSTLINKEIKDKKYESYLEIGYGDGTNFTKIICDKKLAIDTEVTERQNIKKINSDDFFAENTETFDCVFIDGLHHADQVRKDIINSMKFLNKDGVIILHDTIPPTEAHQEVPRNQLSWTGDVWRAVVGLFESYPTLEHRTERADYGLTFIYPNGKKYKKNFENMEMSYAYFNEKKEALLNIVN